MFCGKAQVQQVLLCQGRKLQVTLGQIYPFVGAKFRALHASLSDPHQNLTVFYLFHDPANSAIIKPNGFPRTDIVENIRNRAADPGWCQKIAATVKLGRPTGLLVSRQNELVAAGDGNSIFDCGQIADRGMLFLVLR